MRDKNKVNIEKKKNKKETQLLCTIRPIVIHFLQV